MIKWFALGNKENCPFCGKFMDDAWDHMKENKECWDKVLKKVDKNGCMG